MDDTGQQQQMNNEIDSLLFRTGMYIDELKTLSNIKFNPDDNMLINRNINNEKQIIMV